MTDQTERQRNRINWTNVWIVLILAVAFAIAPWSVVAIVRVIFGFIGGLLGALIGLAGTVIGGIFGVIGAIFAIVGGIIGIVLIGAILLLPILLLAASFRWAIEGASRNRRARADTIYGQRSDNNDEATQG